jgi:hypothetical protein
MERLLTPPLHAKASPKGKAPKAQASKTKDEGRIMATAHLERLLIGIPAASQASFNTWMGNNIEGGANTFTVGLSASGAAPASHYVACGAFTLAELQKILIRLANLAGLPPPSNWSSLSKSARLQWVADNKAAIQSTLGIRIWRSDNDGAWDSFRALITAVGLQFVAPTP